MNRQDDSSSSAVYNGLKMASPYGKDSPTSTEQFDSIEDLVEAMTPAGVQELFDDAYEAAKDAMYAFAPNFSVSANDSRYEILYDLMELHVLNTYLYELEFTDASLFLLMDFCLKQQLGLVKSVDPIEFEAQLAQRLEQDATTTAAILPQVVGVPTGLPVIPGVSTDARRTTRKKRRLSLKNLTPAAKKRHLASFEEVEKGLVEFVWEWKKHNEARFNSMERLLWQALFASSLSTGVAVQAVGQLLGLYLHSGKSPARFLNGRNMLRLVKSGLLFGALKSSARSASARDRVTMTNVALTGVSRFGDARVGNVIEEIGSATAPPLTRGILGLALLPQAVLLIEALVHMVSEYYRVWNPQQRFAYSKMFLGSTDPDELVEMEQGGQTVSYLRGRIEKLKLPIEALDNFTSETAKNTLGGMKQKLRKCTNFLTDKDRLPAYQAQLGKMEAATRGVVVSPDADEEYEMDPDVPLIDNTGAPVSILGGKRIRRYNRYEIEELKTMVNDLNDRLADIESIEDGLKAAPFDGLWEFDPWLKRLIGAFELRDKAASRASEKDNGELCWKTTRLALQKQLREADFDLEPDKLKAVLLDGINGFKRMQDIWERIGKNKEVPTFEDKVFFRKYCKVLKSTPGGDRINRSRARGAATDGSSVDAIVDAFLAARVK